MVEIPVSVGHLTFDDGQNLGGWGMDNAPAIVNGVCEVGNNAAKENDWNAQINYEPGFTFENGKTYHLKMKIKGSVAGELVQDSRILTDTKYVVTSLPSRLQLIGRKWMLLPCVMVTMPCACC